MDEIMQKALNKMVDDLNILIDELNKNPLFEQIKKKKKFINEFSVENDGEIVYRDTEIEQPEKQNYFNIKRGQFKGRPLAKVVREYLEARGKDNPASLQEIEEALKQSDFDFDKVADVRSALVKNNFHFTLLKDDYFGLTEWYYKKGKRNKGDKDTDDNETNGNSEENEKAVEPTSTA